MAAKKFPNDSFEFMFFRDLWKTFEAFGEVEVSENYWNRAIYVCGKLSEKYKNHPMALSFANCLLKELERRYSEMEKSELENPEISEGSKQ